MKRPKRCTGGRSKEDRRYSGQLDSGMVKVIEFNIIISISLYLYFIEGSGDKRKYIVG